MIEFDYVDIFISFYNASVEKCHQTEVPIILFNENLNTKTEEVKLLKLFKSLSSLSFLKY